jgi:phosphotriesterase-related protein
VAGFVRTLTGDVPATELGRTLVHEHLAVDWGEMLGRPNWLEFDYDELVARMVAKMEDLAAAGIGAMTECTPYGAGRYIDLFADVARRSPVLIIASTGFFHESWCPIHPVAVALDADGMAELFVREISQGIGSTLIRAGLIKIATGEDRISAKEEEVARAAARARRRTGCPILAHTTNGMGAELLDILESEDVGPSEVIISHVGFEPDPRAYAASLLERGANISFDRIGFRIFFPDEHWLALVLWALEGGYRDQILLSHDASVFAYGLEAASGENVMDDYTYIPRVFVPRLRAAGLDDGTLDAILTANPQRVLAFAPAGDVSSTPHPRTRFSTTR